MINFGWEGLVLQFKIWFELVLVLPLLLNTVAFKIRRFVSFRFDSHSLGLGYLNGSYF